MDFISWEYFGLDEADRIRLDSMSNRLRDCLNAALISSRSDFSSRLQGELERNILSLFTLLGSISHDLPNRLNVLINTGERITLIRTLLDNSFLRSDPGHKIKIKSRVSLIDGYLGESKSIVTDMQIFVSSLFSSKQDILPNEKSAPIRVTIVTFRLYRSFEKTFKSLLSENAANRLRVSAYHLLITALNILEDSQSNMDRRIFTAFDSLKTYLSVDLESLPIEALGVQYEWAQEFVSDYGIQIPDVPLSMIKKCLSTTHVFLNQYKEWHDYQEVRIALEALNESSDVLRKGVEQLIDDLEAEKTFVHSNITQGLREIMEPVIAKSIQMEAVIGPLTASISNIFSRIGIVLFESLPHIDTSGAFAHGLDAAETYAACVTASFLFKKYGVVFKNIKTLRYINDACLYFDENFPWFSKIVR